jgi:hypothetical protein
MSVLLVSAAAATLVVTGPRGQVIDRSPYASMAQCLAAKRIIDAQSRRTTGTGEFMVTRVPGAPTATCIPRAAAAQAPPVAASGQGKSFAYRCRLSGKTFTLTVTPAAETRVAWTGNGPVNEALVTATDVSWSTPAGSGGKLHFNMGRERVTVLSVYRDNDGTTPIAVGECRAS